MPHRTQAMLINLSGTELSTLLRALRYLLKIRQDCSEHDSYQVAEQTVTKLERAERTLREKTG